MFMEMSEIRNAFKLAKIKIRTNIGKLWIFLGLSAIGLAASLTINFTTLFRTGILNPCQYLDLQAFPLIFSIFAPIIITTYISLHKQFNEKYDVFPQTGNSRFLASLIIIYASLIVVTLTELVLYLIQHLAFYMTSMFMDNVYLGYKFNIGFILAGIPVNLIYLFLAASFIILIAVIYFKFKIYAIFVYSLILYLFFTYENVISVSLLKLLNLLINEKSLPVFLIKGVVVWIVLTIISMIFNKFTRYQRSMERSPITSLITATIIILISVILIRTINPDIREIRDSRIAGITEVDGMIELDASELRYGTEINVGYPSTQKIYGGDPGKITVVYQFPKKEHNGVNLYSYLNFSVSASLTGSDLSIVFDYDKNVKVILLNPWLFMSQFSLYKDKNYGPDKIYSTEKYTVQGINVILPSDGSLKFKPNTASAGK